MPNYSSCLYYLFNYRAYYLLVDYTLKISDIDFVDRYKKLMYFPDITSKDSLFSSRNTNQMDDASRTIHSSIYS